MVCVYIKRGVFLQKIKFDQFVITVRRIDFHYEDNEKEGDLFFEFNQINILSEGPLLIAISLLCGKKYDYIEVDLKVPQNILDTVSTFCEAEIKVKEISPIEYVSIGKKDRVSINFSAGLDSLAASLLFPKDKIDLFSLDFGRGYTREREFFKEFNTNIVRTNFRDREHGFNLNTHMFMAIGTVLYSEKYCNKYMSYGTIMEAGEGYMYHDRLNRLKDIYPPLSSLNITELRLINALTEVGTLLTVIKLKTKDVYKSVISCGFINSEKLARKELLFNILNEEHKCNLKDMDVHFPNEHGMMKFGTKRLQVFLTFYMMKYCSKEDVIKFGGEIPQKYYDAIEGMSLKFYEGFNPNYLHKIPEVFRPDIMKNLIQANILPYDEIDWEEYFKIRDILEEMFRYKKK